MSNDYTETDADKVRRYAHENLALREALAHVPLIPRVRFDSSFRFNPEGACYRPTHEAAPQDWDASPRRAWWRIKFHLCRVGVALPSTGRRLWVYTRWGSMHFDITLDRRPRQK